MTVNITENKIEAPISQDKVEANIQQQKIETNIPNQNIENKEQDSPEDPDWRAFREGRKKDRAEKEAAERKAQEREAEVLALKAAMEAAFSKGSTPSLQQSNQYGYQNEYQPEESEDERIEKKVQAAIAQREAAAEKARMEREHQEYPNRLVQSYPDFHHVISQENIDYLDYHYPEVSRPLQRLRDGFDKWSDIYQAIRKFVPNNTSSKRESAKADANFSKPKSISSTGLTQNTEGLSGMRLTEDRKADNWARMQKILKGVN